MKITGVLLAICLVAALPAAVLARSGTDEAAAVITGVVIGVVYLVVAIVMIAATWKLFVKAGKPGWACIVPIYNMVVLLQIAGKPEWWVVLMFVPFANIIVLLMMDLGIAENFGKSTGFGLGLFFLPIIFMPVLAFGDARYAASLQPGEVPVSL